MPFRRSLVPAAVAAAFLGAAGDAAGQGYTLRPGTRGFDPRMNRYGATEEPRPATAADAPRSEPSKTTVTVEILMPGNGAGLDAQTWSQKLAGIGYPARIRQPVGGDKPDVSETTRGPLRFVTVVGTLDRSGALTFPGRSFTPDRTADLKEWLDELKTYGAQGSPEGKPLWGLTRPQFEAVYQSLAAPTTADLAGLSTAEALAELPLPQGHPLRFTAEAKRSLDGPDRTDEIDGGVTGLTGGTALAFVLSRHGLGFRPNRTPEGSIELVVEPLPTDLPGPGEGAGRLVLWPVGWAIEETAAPAEEKVRKNAPPLPPPNRAQLAPGLFEMTTVDLPNVPLVDALAAAERAAGIPVLLDRAGLASAGIDLAKLRVNLPPRRSSWNIALRSATFPNRLRHEVRRDEAGSPFVWVTPLGRGR